MNSVAPTRFLQPQPAHQDYIRYISALEFSDIPDDVIAQAKRLLLDQMACIVAARATDVGPIISAGAAIFGNGPMSRAYELCRLGDVMDFDDGCVGAHFGCGAVAAALALAETTGATGQELITAIVAGFEAGARMMRTIGPYATMVEGEPHFLPVWGIATPIVYAAIGAAANILKLPPEIAVEAFSIGGAATPVPIGGKWSEAILLPNTKYCDSGWAAAVGVSGALLAQSGSTGLTSLLDKDRGLFDMLHMPEAKPDLLGEALGDDWLLRQIQYKQWPCCGQIFGALTLVQQLMAEHALGLDEIDSLAVGVTHSTRLPRFVNPNPATYVSLQFSVPHNIAMLIMGIPPGPRWHSAAWADDAALVGLRHRIAVGALLPDHTAKGFTSHVTITARDKTFAQGAGPAAPGTRRPPSDDAGIAAKFRAQVADPQAARLQSLVAEIETLSAGQDLFSTLQAAVAR